MVDSPVIERARLVLSRAELSGIPRRIRQNDAEK